MINESVVSKRSQIFIFQGHYNVLQTAVANFLSRFSILKKLHTVSPTVKNTVISPKFLEWKFCGKAQFPHSFGRIAQSN